MTKLTRRERVSLALQHQETDRIPVDFGGKLSGIALESYNELKKMLRISRKTQVLDARLQLAKVDEDVLEQFSIDTRYIYQKPAATWDPKWFNDTYVDEWGIRLGRPSGGLYYDYIEFPLNKANDLHDLDRFVWPDSQDLSRNIGLVEEASTIVKETNSFMITTFKGPFEQAWALRGFDKYLLDTILNPDFAEVLLDKVIDIQKKIYGPFLEKVGPYLDMVCFTDDLGGQNAPIISPKMYIELVKPRHRDMVEFIKEKTDGALVALHCCGSVNKFIPDFCDIGIDVLNPIQVTADGMDINFLKSNYGNKLSFWGAIDTQKLLNFGKPEEVSLAAEETCRILGKGGGYLFSPAHNIQAKTPIQNILILFEKSKQRRNA